MSNNAPTMVWPTTFEPPPQKGPPPKIPLPKIPTPGQMRNDTISPMSQPPAAQYFNNVNYSPSTPSRVPPKTNVRPPALHRVSEIDSHEESDDFEPPAPLFRSTSNGSLVSPHTIVDHAIALPPPSAFDLDTAARKGSEPGPGIVSSQPSYPRARTKSSLPYIDDDDEPPPFVMKSDKHKRILGIDQKTPQIKRSHEKREKSAPKPPVHRETSFPDLADRSSSPLPASDVVPFLYQDIEVRHFVYPTDVIRMCEDNPQSRLLYILTLFPPCPLPSLTSHHPQIYGTDTAVQILRLLIKCIRRPSRRQLRMSALLAIVVRRRKNRGDCWVASEPRKRRKYQNVFSLSICLIYRTTRIEPVSACESRCSIRIEFVFRPTPS